MVAGEIAAKWAKNHMEKHRRWIFGNPSQGFTWPKQQRQDRGTWVPAHILKRYGVSYD